MTVENRPTLADLNLHGGVTRLLKYVAWQDVAAYEALGWVYLYPAPAHHGVHAAILEWALRETPKMPKEGYLNERRDLASSS